MSTDLEVYEHPASLTLFRTDEPGEVVAQASQTASALADVVNKQELYANVQGKKHVLVEGWTLLGSMLGVFPVLDGDPQEVEVAGVRGWRATVKAVLRDGSVVGRASALCLRSEANWKNRDEYALMSMAQTRATSKALRQPLGFVMSLAGFSATPAEEMPRGGIPGEAEVIEEAEIIRDPEGRPFPDQADLEPDIPFEAGVYKAPAGARGGGNRLYARYMGLKDKDARFTLDYIKSQMQASHGTKDDRKLLAGELAAWEKQLDEWEAS